jgi:anaerobic selenocysteine-containing dehydrogenase
LPGRTQWCAIEVFVQDGRAVRVRGNQNSKTNHGYVCPRGHLIPQQLYDPDCIKVPMKRANPVKGHGVDPKWVPISWDEALDTVAEKMFELRRGNETHKLVYLRGRYSSTSTDLRYTSHYPKCSACPTARGQRLRPSTQALYSSPAAMIVSHRVV